MPASVNVNNHNYEMYSCSCCHVGWILIDRCGNHFGSILNFLRDGCIPLPESVKETAELLAEARYYCITDLAESCERALQKKAKEAEPICRVALITSQKEENLLIGSTTKVSLPVHFIHLTPCVISAKNFLTTQWFSFPTANC